MRKFAISSLIFLVFLSLLTPLWVFKDLLFPYITSKAYFFRILMQAALPFYLYLILTDSRLRPDWKNPLTVSVVVFFVANLISGLWGINVIKSLWGNYERMGGVFYLLHLGLLYFYILLLAQLNDRYVKWFVQGLIGVSLMVALNGISGWLGGPILIQDPSLPGRASSTLGNPIFFASLLILPMTLCIFFGLGAENLKKKILYYTVSALLLWGVYISATRGAIVGLIGGAFLGLIFYVFLEKRKDIKIIGLSVVGVVVAAVVLMFIFAEKLPEGSILKRLTNLNDTNASARLIQWRSALEGYKDRPLLGTGPENYYVVSNLYWNPEMYKYDGSWFDKPHNYWLEILVTTGIFGFTAFISLFIFTLYALYYAFRKDVLSLKEFCVLVAGFLAYQAQNLFVFDTVSPSVMFFGFTGFVGYLWFISTNIEGAKSKKIFRGLNPAFAQGVLIMTVILIVYVEYASNFVGMSISKKVNYAYAYSNVDPKKSNDYFNQLFSQPFNFDITETTGKFADFGLSLLQRNDPKLDKDFVKDISSRSISHLEKVTNEIKNDPILYQRLANLYLFQTHFLNTRDFFKAEEAIRQAIELAPNRTEARQALFQIRVAQNRIKEAEEIINQIIDIQPQRQDFHWQKAILYSFTSRPEQGAEIAEQVLAQGFLPRSLQDLEWLIKYYQNSKAHAKLIALFEVLNKSQPGNTSIILGLAGAYAEAGDKEKALEIANYFLLFKSGEEQKQIQAFIDSLK